MFKFLQKLGKSMMLVVAVLPACGLLLGLGYFLCPTAMSQNVETLSLLSKIGLLLVKTGNAVINNMSLLFVIGVALGMSDDNHGSVCFSALVSWLIVTNLLNPDTLSIFLPFITANQIYYLAFQKISNPFVAILVGITCAMCYNKYKNVELVDAFSFFSGRRFVIIVVVLCSLVLCVVLCIIWPIFFSMFVAGGKWILGLKGIGVGIYAFLNRLLIPSGLHHALNNVFWFDTIGIGDLTSYWAGKTSSDVTWDLGMYMSGFFPSMMFGVPGASLAIITSSKNKKKAMGLFLSSAICAFVCGLTEPFEFAFMFVAFPLYVVYSLLYGIFAYIAYIVSFRAGFAFSAGALDLLFSSTLPAAKNILLIIPLGIAAFIVYFLVFKLLIAKFHFNIVDDESENIETSTEQKSITKGGKASIIYEALGGTKNIVNIDCCTTRLRIEVKDIGAVDENKIKTANVLGYVKNSNNSCQIIIGLKVQQVLEEIKNIMNHGDTYISSSEQLSEGDIKVNVKHGENIDKYFGDLNNKETIIDTSKCETCEFEYVVKLKNGMHARPASKIVNIAKEHNAKIELSLDGKTANGDSITSIMALGIVNGTKISVKIVAVNVTSIKSMIEECLNEEG